MSELILIDGNSLINRAFFAIGMLNARDGTPTNALLGFTTMLIKLIETRKPTHIAVAFDLRAPTFRHKKYDLYKATRKGMPDDLAIQMPMLKELLTAMNIKYLEQEGYEADDILGTLSDAKLMPTVIVTGDRDSLQLVDETTTVLLTKRGISETEEFTPAHFQSIYGFSPEKIVDLKALMGDSSDNIPGVKGVGEKTAMELLHTYGSLDGVYSHLDDVKGALKTKLEEGRELARLSYELATICKSVPLDVSKDDLRYDFPFNQSVRSLFGTYSFRVLQSRDSLFKGEDAVAPKQANVAQTVLTAAELNKVDFGGKMSVLVRDAAVFAAANPETEYQVKFQTNLIDPGDSPEDTLRGVKVFNDPSVVKTVFDAKALRRYVNGYGGEISGIEFDVQLAQYVADCTRPNGTIDEVLEFFGMGAYSPTPAAGLLALRAELEKELITFNRVFYDIEMPLTDVLFRMEKRGVCVDGGELEQAGRSLLKEMIELEERIKTEAGHSFNINSPKQIGQVLFEEMGLLGGKKTKGKNFSTSVDVLEGLRGVPIVDAILRYRTVAKLYNTYIEGIRKLLGKDNVIHTVYKQTVTATGRLSSVEPNLQNIPIRSEEGKALRKAFVARPGYSFVSADYSQIELRLLAHFSQEEALIEAYRKGEDIHATTAAMVFNVPRTAVTPAMRSDAKAVNFGIIYGISDFGLSRNLNTSVALARKYIQGYFMKYPRVKEYMDGLVEQAHREGKLSTPTGRTRKFENINSTNFQVRSFNERAAMNMPLQATAADLIKMAMIKVDKALRSEKLDAALLLQVHDELIVEARDDTVERVKKLLKENMENAMSLRVPLIADVSTGKTWYDL